MYASTACTPKKVSPRPTSPSSEVTSTKSRFGNSSSLIVSIRVTRTTPPGLRGRSWAPARRGRPSTSRGSDFSQERLLPIRDERDVRPVADLGAGVVGEARIARVHLHRQQRGGDEALRVGVLPHRPVDVALLDAHDHGLDVVEAAVREL